MVRLGRSYPATRTVTPHVVAQSVSFDTVGVGNTGNVTSLSWSHTVGASANAAVAFLDAFTTNATPTITVTFGGTSMTQLGVTASYTSSSHGYVYAFGLQSPPTGAQTVSVSVSGAGATSDLVGNSASYNNVTGFGTAVVTNAASGNPSMSASSTTGQMVANAFGGFNVAFSAYTQTQRYLKNFVSGVNLSFVMGDAPGAASVSFGVTAGTGTQAWGGVAVPLL